MAAALLDRIRSSEVVKYPSEFQHILDLMGGKQSIGPNGEDFIWRAYNFGKKAHQGQLRKSGEPYFSHCVEVATILAEMKLDPVTISAALLHDVIEDTGYTHKDVEQEFSEEVARLVDGVTKLSDMKFRSEEDKQAINFRKMLLSVADDIRVIIIKFADRLHNMRTLEHLPAVKQRRIARETRDVYAPLAHRLGMYRIKSEMEDLIFNILEPKASQELQKLIPKRQVFFEKYVQKFLEPVKEKIEEAGFEAVYKSRFKSHYSIFRKMQDQNRPFEDVFDIYAVRIIVDRVETCYSVLGLIHAFYTPIQERFKDFIAQPKSNGYQSIQTTVVGPEGFPVEVQVRTKEMDDTAEEGVAAHWQYKEQDSKSPQDDIDQQVTWLRNLVDILQTEDKTTSHQFMDLLKIDLYKDEIFVYTPKGEVRILPLGATPLDFAFDVHSQVGLHCIGAKVNGRIKPLNSELESGNKVEIITSDSQKPNSSWLKIVKTSKAKSNIRKWIKSQEFEQSVKLGKEILERELRKIKKAKEWKHLKDPYATLKFESEEKMIASIGSGHRTVSSILTKFFPDEYAKPLKEQSEKVMAESFLNRARRNTKGVSIHGIDNMMISFGKCCNPIPGDPIVGFITRGRGITVHQRGCDTVGTNLTEVERIIDVDWATARSQTFLVRLKILAQERKNLVRDVTEMISSFDINIDTLSMKVDGDVVTGLVIIEVEGVKQLDRLKAKLLASEGVISVERE
ncbi:MAG: bifunctional (p)ppGpp synthetase/guanosine-3',5'-bis(diphosphate) 3'-pyrophosphohydrolase [Candidatus Marinimicrobia bacterium]|nr:bifunctional (p)ppGpp synthetase/guanosine-3',5'-bis(diphosphate) 3'-pyrophosphohydrolase [Candidatus Neomarinimicrobiota bacterium]MCF7921895.1 bifunctional (p)ppGpp synthetase/guanosine-3',5'-bis(diphosphate) 3'-pyrophosphohydrolase [Candidatus Neomarinimicrobiota bacterium]